MLSGVEALLRILDPADLQDTRTRRIEKQNKNVAPLLFLGGDAVRRAQPSNGGGGQQH